MNHLAAAILLSLGGKEVSKKYIRNIFNLS